MDGSSNNRQAVVMIGSSKASTSAGCQADFDIDTLLCGQNILTQNILTHTYVGISLTLTRIYVDKMF